MADEGFLRLAQQYEQFGEEPVAMAESTFNKALHAFEDDPRTEVVFVDSVDDEPYYPRDAIGIKLPFSRMSCDELHDLIDEVNRKAGATLDPEFGEVVIVLTYRVNEED